MPTPESHRTAVTLVHSQACHYCDEAAVALAEIAESHPIDVMTVALESPEGAALVARHRPAMNPLVLLDGEYFSSGRLPQKKLLHVLAERGVSAATPARAGGR